MFNCKKEEEVNVKRALEMLQAELWLAVSMRKKEKKKAVGYFPLRVLLCCHTV